MTNNYKFGHEAGEVCWRDGCQGVIAEHRAENCSCHISPPCSECTTPREFCPECDWNAEDEASAEYLNGYRAIVDKKSEACWKPVKGDWELQPLDPRRIDYHIFSHSNSSQICEGVYPTGTTAKEVEEICKGTFGGRFESFGGGKFKYIAYTD